MFTAVNSKGSGESGTVHTRIRIPYVFNKSCCVQLLKIAIYRPLAGYGLPPPPRGNLVDHIFLEAQCLARILQHVSPLTMAALSCNSLLYTLPYKIFDN